jgi:hypothetical protein
MEEKKEENKTIDNWFDEYDKPTTDTEYERLPIFEMKLAQGKLTRTEEIVFVSEGHKANTRFGETIVFTIRNQDTDKTWFIKKTQYSLLNPIARERKTGTIIGKTAIVERVGSGAKDTKWNLNFKTV